MSFQAVDTEAYWENKTRSVHLSFGNVIKTEPLVAAKGVFR
jgi:hypothetical protein